MIGILFSFSLILGYKEKKSKLVFSPGFIADYLHDDTCSKSISCFLSWLSLLMPPLVFFAIALYGLDRLRGRREMRDRTREDMLNRLTIKSTYMRIIMTLRVPHTFMIVTMY